jgi:hypothetical protein
MKIIRLSQKKAAQCWTALVYMMLVLLDHFKILTKAVNASPLISFEIV